MSTEGAAPARREGGISVLYVDDDAGIRRLVEKALTRHGFSVSFAANGDEGIEKVKTGTFDVVTVDHYMPGKDGLATLEAIQKLPDPPPVIYVTGADESRIAVAALKAGAADYVIKDVEGIFLELLRSAVLQAVEQRRLIRQQEEAERLLREGRDRLELLLREVNHRVANSLQLVSSLVTMQTAVLTDPAARDALTETQGRIAAIGQIHRRLYTSEDVRFVEIGTYIEGLLEELQGALRSDGRPHPIRVIEAARVLVPTDRAVSLGMIVTELVTNAYKYAYPDGAEGEIRVALRKADGDVVLCVEDDGVGWTGEGETKGSGLGTKIINSMARVVGAPMEFDASHKGTRVLLRFPAD